MCRRGRRPWRLPSGHREGWCRYRHRPPRGRPWSWQAAVDRVDGRRRLRAYWTMATPRWDRVRRVIPAGASIGQSATGRRKYPWVILEGYLGGLSWRVIVGTYREDS